MHFRKRAKAVTPYIVGGTKISLDVLSKVTSLINPPCVGTVINMASQIITIVEGVKANRDDTNTLAGRLLGLLVVISDSYQGRSDDGLPMDIRMSVQRLHGQLDVILAEVEEMRAATDPRTIGGFINGGLLYARNGQKIKEYTARIGWAMDSFQVEGRVRDAIHLRDVHTKVSETYTDVKDMQVDVRGIRGALENMTIGPNSRDTVPLSSSMLPSQPTILYGRDQEVNNIVSCIMSTERPRFAILGPGGIGKTALLLAVREHTDIKQKFGESRPFVRCEEATSAALLVELIARGLRTETSSSDRMDDIKTRLRSADEPILLLLDNFETPWDIPGEQTRVEDILASLASFPHVAILITIRSNVPPSTHIPWSRPFLEPLSVLPKDAAHDLYASIDPNAVNDSSLGELLTELSYMPLAITLMASLGRTGETPTALLKAWKNKMVGTDLLYGTDKNQSVNISIRLSIESNRMASVPEALTLLSVLAVLPAGASVTLLPALVPSIQNFVLAKATLRGAALANPEASARVIQLLSPIRAYVLKYHPLSDDLKGALHNAYIEFVTKHNSEMGDLDFVKDAKALEEEETNLEMILLDAIQTGSDVAVDTAITFCNYQLNTRPRLEVIQKVVQVCRERCKLHHLARSEYCFGTILHRLCQYTEAQAAFADADKRYTELGDRLGATGCLWSLGKVLVMQDRYDEARAALEEADRKYAELGDRLGATRCLEAIGDIHRMQHRYDEAQAALEEAYRRYTDLGDRLDAAGCLWSLGDIHRMQQRYDEAQAVFAEADRKYTELGDRLGATRCLETIGDIHRMQHRYDEAQAVLEEAYRRYTDLGDRLGAAGCLWSLANTHRMQHRYDEARAAFEEADRRYTELGNRLSTAHCHEGLGKVHRMQGQFTEAETKLIEARTLFQEFGLELDATRCSKMIQSITSIL